MLKENNGTFNFNEEQGAINILNEIITTATNGSCNVREWFAYYFSGKNEYRFCIDINTPYRTRYYDCRINLIFNYNPSTREFLEGCVEKIEYRQKDDYDVFWRATLNTMIEGLNTYIKENFEQGGLKNED